jgi:hypothetical protein
VEPTGWLDLVLARAAELRKAGVRSIGVAGCSVELETWVEPLPPDTKRKPDSDDEHPDALNDPATYGGGPVPGFQIQQLSEGEKW